MLVYDFLKRYTQNDKLPFSFIYDGTEVKALALSEEPAFKSIETNHSTVETITIVTPDKLLKAEAQITLFKGFNAMEIALGLENAGEEDTKIIENIYSLCVGLHSGIPPMLYRSNGAPSNTNDFIPRTVSFADYSWQGQEISGTGGRSSNSELPYFRVDCDKYSAVFGIGWSGQFKSVLCFERETLTVKCGMEGTHFKLLPGEKVHMPFVTVLFEEDHNLSFSSFRRLVYEHYVPSKDNAYLFCNTCFTRGGAWLNECNEDNQVSLIKAMQKLDVESVITDAGWFIGGWPTGAGCWDTDPEKYPNGIEVVSKKAKELGMKYGLWFELERVVEGSTAHKEHPDWCLGDHLSFLPSQFMPGKKNFLLNLGIPEAVDYAYNIVDNYLKLPGFSCYRQDFNVDPLGFWRSNDTPDRMGITEIKHLNGLYDFLDRIRANYPDVFMDGCSSGGRRLDLAMIRRFNTNQKTDYWFDTTVDQTSLYSLNCYLPSISFTTHVDKLNDYAFYSNLAATLCIGFIADEPGFDYDKAKNLLSKFLTVRPLLNDRYYPLTPIDDTGKQILAMEFYDRSMDKGVIIICNRGGQYGHTSMHPTNYNATMFDARGVVTWQSTVYPKDIKQSEMYLIKNLISGIENTLSGKQLLDGFQFIVGREPQVIVYTFEKM